MEQRTEKKERSLTPDVCRGIAIFCVIWGHVLQQGLSGVMNVTDNNLLRIIYAFHMPLFVLISGYFFYVSQKKRSLKDVVVPRGIMFLKIILIWNTFHYLLSGVLQRVMGEKYEITLSDWWKAITEGYWFFWSMLFCMLAVGLTVKCMPRSFWLIGFVLFILPALISPCRWVIFSVYPFFIGGFLYRRWAEEGSNIPAWVKYVSLPVFVVTIIVYLFTPAVGNSEWMNLLKMAVNFLKGTAGFTDVMDRVGAVLMYYVLGLTGSISIIVLTDMVVRKWKKNTLIQAVGKLGQCSLQIYVIQRVIVELVMGRCYGMFVKQTGYNPVADNVGGFTWLYSFLISVAATFLIFFLIRYALPGKVGKYLFGR